MEVIIEKSNETREVKPGDIIKIDEQVYLIVKPYSENNKIYLVDFEGESMADYKASEFQTIFSKWENCKLFSKEEYSVGIKNK